MAKKKFVSPAIYSVDGFVNPDEGDEGERIHGTIQEFKPPVGSVASAGFFIIKLLSPCSMVLNTEEEKVKLPKGSLVGLNKYICFEGLQDHIGEILDAKFLGTKDLGKGREPAKQFEIELDDGK